MADRSVVVRLKAKADEYVAGMDEAARATREVGTEAEKLAQQRQSFEMLGRSALAMGAVAAAGVALAISKWADFDQAMSNVRAATHESEAGMEQLSNAALDAGARTVFSAEEAANAIEELAKAGVSTADILSGGLDGALDLAAAGGLGVAEAAGIAATALKTFNLEGTDMAHVSDLLAAGAGKAMGDVTDLSAALNQSAMVANATGLSIEETTAGLAAFASQGLIGSDAGTSFKSMLQALTPTSGAAADKMKELGISAYDQQGKFVGLAEFAGQLKSSLSDLTVEQQQAALKTIFGSDAIRAATVLYSEGESGIQKWIEAVDDQGYAAETAAARLDNLKGDLEALGGALDTALIKTGEGADGPLRDMVKWLTEAVDAYNELPAPMQSAALALGILTAGVGILGGGMLLAVPKIAEFKIALSTLGITGGGARNALMGITRFLGGPWGIAMMAAAASVAVFNASMDASKVSAEGFEMGIKQGSGALDTMREAAEKNEQGLVKVFADVGGQVDKLPELLDKASTSGRGFWSSMSFNETAMLDNLKEFGSALSGIASSDLPRAQEQFSAFGESASLSREQLAVALDEMPAFKKALLDTADASGMATDDATLLALALGEVGPAALEGADGTDEQANALEALAGVASDTSEAVADLADDIRNFGSAQFDTERAAISFQESLASLDEQMQSGAASLDITTQAGRDTQSALLDVAAAANENAASIAAVGGSTDAIQGALEAGRQKIIDTRLALGDSAAAAKAYADRLIATPEAVKTQVQLSGVEAAQRIIDNFIAANASKRINIAVGAGGTGGLVAGSANGNMFAYADGGMEAYANGGFPTGIYSGGAPIHKFAEPETGWEAYISGKPGQEARNRQIWVEAGNKLGMNGSGGSGGKRVTNNISITAAPGMDEEGLANRVIKKLEGLL